MAPTWNQETVRGWGMAVRADSRVLRPTTKDQVADAFADVRTRGGSIALRGSGCSYGDAAICGGGHVLDLSRMNKILAFDPIHGVARVEPGVTIRDLWRTAIPFGFWPKVVSGTMAVSIGGAAAMNIHGKNNFAVGSFGECVRRFSMLLPDGSVVECSREQNADLFFAAISGFGMLGCFLELEVELKRVHSGRLRVHAIVCKDLAANLEAIERMQGEADYLVSWIDFHAKGAQLGRGVLHRADQLQPGEDPEGVRYFDPCMQDVPTTMFGVVPKGWLWPGMWGAVKLGQVGLVNALKFAVGPREQRQSPYLQSHGAFHFLLDYVPRWHWMTKPGGLIQFQPFVPRAHAERVFRTLAESCHKEGMVPYLGVLKRHRPDPFLMTHAVDGFSMAMDFAVSTSKRKRDALWTMCRRMAEVVLDAGGRFYYAKDAVLEAPSFPRVHGEDVVQCFRSLKLRCDPRNMLQTDLSRRLLG